MTDQEKTSELIQLMDALCDPSFAKEDSTIENWIKRLNKVYANGYRHTYSDIFFKVQTIIKASDDTETLEILGENLNELGKSIDELLLHNIDDANLQNTSISFKKFADHIKLEIGRYNFIKSHFSVNKKEASAEGLSGNIDSKDFQNVKEKVDKLSGVIDNVQPMVNRVQTQMDKVDEKLESNKISSITTLTIFSAVVLAFSGGITFEAGIFKGMVESSPYRLVFTIALTGFILFNTIFALLYLVGKMAGKTISTRCKYLSLEKEGLHASRRCGDGYCQRECSSVNLFCRILHKYSYVVAINFILLWTMYADFVLWLFKGQAYTATVLLWQSVPVGFIAIYLVVTAIRRKVQERKIELQFKVQLINRIVNQADEDVPLSSRIGQIIINAFGGKKLDLSESLLKIIKDDKVVTDKDYKKILKKIDAFVNAEILKNHRLCNSISRRAHLQNKKDWKSLRDRFRQYLLDTKPD